MDVVKLRIKFGVDELEAEGTQEFVEKQRDIFMERIKNRLPAKPVADDLLLADATKSQNGRSSSEDDGSKATIANLPVSLADMKKIATQEGDTITLTAVPSGETADEDSLKLLLLAHKVMRSVDSVQTDDLLAGMKQSGRSLDRLDRVFGRIDPSLILRTGVKRGTKYRLTNPGVVKAKAIAEQLLLTVA